MLKLNSQYAQQNYLRQPVQNKRCDSSKSYSNLAVGSKRSISPLPLGGNDGDLRTDQNYQDKYSKDNCKKDYGLLTRNRDLIQKSNIQNNKNISLLNLRQITRYREAPKSYAYVDKNQHQLLDNNHDRIKDKPSLYTQKSAYDGSVFQNYRQRKADRQNQQKQSYSAYSKYISKPSAIDSKYPNSGMTKHTKRNQEIRNRILKEQLNNYAVDNHPKNTSKINNYDRDPQDQYQAYLHNDAPYPYQQEINYGRPDDSSKGRAQRQTSNRQYESKGQLNSKKGYSLLDTHYSQQLPQNNKEYDTTIAERFDRSSLMQRKQTIKKQIENTPERNYQGCRYQPGSSDRKKSLIEKSQVLQQKLKKLSTQYPTQKDSTSHLSLNKDSNQQRSARQTPAISNTYSFNRGNSCLRGNFTNTNHTGSTTMQLNASPLKNTQGIRSRSPVLAQDSNMRSAGQNTQAIDKIAKLNQKINERIQSIISNYTNK